MFYTCKIYLNAFILIHPTGIIYIIDVFFVKPEYNRTFYRRLKTLKKGDRRASKTSSENLGGFINKPWRVQRRTLEGSRKDLGGSKNTTFTDYLKTYYA